MNIKKLRLRLQQLALEIEILDLDKNQLTCLPAHIPNSLTNLERDVTNEIARIVKKEKREYENGR